MARPSPRSAPCARSWQSSPNSFPSQQRCRVEAQGHSAPAVPGLSSSSPRTQQPSRTRDQATRLSTSALCKLFGADYTKRTSRAPVSASTGHHWHLPGSAGLSFVLSCHRTEPVLIKASKQLCCPVPLCSEQGSLGGMCPPQPRPSSPRAAAGLVLSPTGSSHLPPCPQAAPPGKGGCPAPTKPASSDHAQGSSQEQLSVPLCCSSWAKDWPLPGFPCHPKGAGIWERSS